MEKNHEIHQKLSEDVVFGVGKPLPSGVIKQGWLENPQLNAGFWLGKLLMNGPFFIAMFDY